MAATATDLLSQDSPQNVSTPPPVRPGWALFDTSVVLGDSANHAAAAAAVSLTSNGQHVRVSLHRFVAPPASSCIELYTDDELSEFPSVVAADGDLLLLHMGFAVKNDPLAQSPHSFFVYKVDPEFPWMLSLPPPRGWFTCSKYTGIALCGDGFVVANLMVCRDWDLIDDTTMREVERGILRRYRSSTDEWETKTLEIPHDPEQGLVPFRWFTDTVFCFRGYGCWVDYHIGILYCDVLSPDPELRFVRFPGIDIRRGDRGRPDFYRTVSACRGHVKFVNIDNGQFWFTGSDDEQELSDSEDDEECIMCRAHCRYHSTLDHDRESDDYGCTITTWTLKMPEFEWVEDTTLQVEELWSLLSDQHLPLPRTVPTFPVISPQEDGVLHFVLRGPKFFDKAWMLTVDMKKKSLGNHTLYENPIREKDSTFDDTNTFYGNPRVIIEQARDKVISSEHALLQGKKTQTL